MKLVTTVLALLAGATALSASAGEIFEPRRIEPDVWRSAHFQYAHPDLKHRVIAQNLLEDGRTRAAIPEFERAASWGDKLSQAMLAEIYWEGRGIKPDRARAYAWMDLAAERGFVAFVSKRERYWAALTPEEREAALVIGAELYAANGDEIAVPRLQARVERERGTTGSRIGFAGNGTVVMPGEGATRVQLTDRLHMAQLFGGRQMSLTAYYSPQLWQPQKYIDWHADQLELARRGVVRVGQVEDSGGGSGNGS